MARHVSRRRREEPRAFWKIVLTLWIVFIWVHSMIPGPVSSEESMLVVRLFQPILRMFGISDTNFMQLIIRKGAHFSEYAILGTLAVVALQPRLAVPLWPAVLTVILWVAVPSIDEYIQVHVPGRAGMRPSDSAAPCLCPPASFFCYQLIIFSKFRKCFRQKFAEIYHFLSCLTSAACKPYPT